MSKYFVAFIAITPKVINSILTINRLLRIDLILLRAICIWSISLFLNELLSKVINASKLLINIPDSFIASVAGRASIPRDIEYNAILLRMIITNDISDNFSSRVLKSILLVITLILTNPPINHFIHSIDNLISGLNEINAIETAPISLI